ncbi:valine--tRNA ligase [Candidatus Dependentiae bacterium]
MEKRYDHKKSEQEAQQLWENEQTYTTQNNPGNLFSIDTPPPTVSGSLHIGHICSYTQTDIMARYRRMSGLSVFYPFGFDDNGLPTERYVEKKLKIRAHQLSRSEFIKKCLGVTHEVEAEFKALWQQMGLSVDWSLCYSTISDDVRKIAQHSFIELLHKDFVYRKDEPALYCTTCRTSVAQAELDDEEKPSYFNDIVFSSHDGKDLIIGTTRPELLPSTVALLYHPDDTRYQHLKGTNATVPLFGQEVPIYEDEKVEIEKGTGLVMISTFGDTTDIEWFKKFKLPYKPSIGRDGKMLPHTDILAGLKVKAAREKVLEELKSQGLLLQQKEISHTVNVHERCKKPVEIIALPQWFLKILDHKKTFLELADQINWYPAYMKARYNDWVQNLSWDWCLSRQRFYGIAFPVWHCKDCDEVLVAPIENLPIDPQETEYPGGCCTKCNGSNIKADTDVMDTWNCSSLTPQILSTYFAPGTSPFTDKNIGEFMPMSMRPQAHDIIRTWAFYTIVKAWMHHGTIPWKDIVISGHVLSDKSVKLSKSKNNAGITPEGLLKTYAADAIRYWTASGALGKDISFSETQVKIGQKLITKLWNAFRFISMHIEALEDPAKKPATLGVVNEWILHKATQCFAQYQKSLEVNEFNLALGQIEKFFWTNFCDNYLELIKDQLFNPDNYDAQEIEATRWTLYHVGLRILQLYAPYQPHVTESIYQALYQKQVATPSLHQTRFTNVQQTHEFAQSVNTMELILSAVAQVRKLKTENSLSLGTSLKELTIVAQEKKVLDLVAQHVQLLKGATRAENITFAQESLESGKLIKEGEEYLVKVVLP